MPRKRYKAEAIIHKLREADARDRRVHQGMLHDPHRKKDRFKERDRGLRGSDGGARHSDHIRSDNGPEMVAKALRKWLRRLGTRTIYITPDSPWENGYCESFNGKLRDEFLNGELFYTFKKAQVLIEKWRMEYNTIRPHSSFGYRPSAPEAVMPKEEIPDLQKAGYTNFQTRPVN